MQESDLTIAADSGLSAFDALGLMPDLLVGDMDSVDPAVLARYEGRLPEHRLNCIKDDTDGVDALDLAIARGAKEITLLGALGGRLDHTLANIQNAASAAAEGANVTILDEREEITFLTGGTLRLIDGSRADYSPPCADKVQT